jgi:hypothetical protein
MTLKSYLMGFTMAKQIEYPRASLKNSLELAQAIDDLGGICSVEMAADKLNKKVSGSFQALIGAAVRYGLISNKKGQLGVTGLFRDHKLAYNKEESDVALSLAFLAPPLFRQIFDRFDGRELPVSHFEKLLMREFGVPDQISSRVAKYFLEGAKQCALLTADNKLRAGASGGQGVVVSNEGADDEGDELDAASENTVTKNQNSVVDQDVIENEGRFSVRIKGPGMDSVIIVNDEEDLLIIRAMLKKVEKKIASLDDTEWGDDV